MAVKQTTSYTDEAFAYARELVEGGEFGSISAAASAALLALKRAREAEARLLEAEVLRRAQLPPDAYVEWRPGLLLDAWDRGEG
jgi:Arc/MetJ-type ribon-helix-helix transcriptional regulator